MNVCAYALNAHAVTRHLFRELNFNAVTRDVINIIVVQDGLQVSLSNAPIGFV